MAKRKFWKTRQFKKLQNQWEQKLKATGFKSAELLIDGKLVLRQRSATVLTGNGRSQTSAEIVDNKARYYDLLGEYFHKETFTDDVERLVMERRASGDKIKTICEELKALGERCYRNTISGIIKKYEIKWGIKR